MLNAPVVTTFDHDHETEIDRDVISPWLALDRFIRELERSRQVPDRFSMALATIHESTSARLGVCLHRRLRPSCRKWLVRRRHRRGWCAELTRGLAAQLPRGGSGPRAAMEQSLDSPSGPIPHTAVILPVEPTRGRRGWSSRALTPTTRSTSLTSGSSPSSGGFKPVTIGMFGSTRISRKRCSAWSAASRRPSTPRTHIPAAIASALPGSP